MFIAIAGAMQGMMHIDEGAIVSGKSMLVVLCIVAGTIIGELIGIEGKGSYFIDKLFNYIINCLNASFSQN